VNEGHPRGLGRMKVCTVAKHGSQITEFWLVAFTQIRIKI
jgi:hypothetical protein